MQVHIAVFLDLGVVSVFSQELNSILSKLGGILPSVV